MEVKVPNSKKPIKNEDELMRLLKKTAKGVTTDLTNYAEKILKYYTAKNIYYGEPLVDTEKSAYKRSGHFYKAITRSNTENFGDSFYAEAYFDKGYLEANQQEPQYRITKNGNLKLVSFGRYVDIYNNFVGDEMLEEGWIEEGTSNDSIVPRRGAHMLEDTASDIENFINRHGIDSSVYSEWGKVSIERIR